MEFLRAWWSNKLTRQEIRVINIGLELQDTYIFAFKGITEPYVPFENWHNGIEDTLI